jgi:hypothetical protein
MDSTSRRRGRYLEFEPATAGTGPGEYVCAETSHSQLISWPKLLLVTSRVGDDVLSILGLLKPAAAGPGPGPCAETSRSPPPTPTPK